jgi:hypothetical protein
MTTSDGIGIAALPTRLSPAMPRYKNQYEYRRFKIVFLSIGKPV